MTAATAFTPKRAQAVLTDVCRSLSLDPNCATLARFGENATYKLESQSVAIRVGRSYVAAQKETDVAKWLEANDFPAARLAKGYDSPIEVSGLPVTFWEFIEEGTEAITPADFGGVLRDLHALPDPTDFDLPSFSPMPKVGLRLDAMKPGLLSPAELQFLRARLDEISHQFDELQFLLPPGPIHGDAHPGNMMRSPDGVIHLIDFEDFSYGPREWDAAVLSVRHQAFGWASEEEYRTYVAAYGFDASTWQGFPTLRAARELNMTTWLAQKLGESAEIDAEVHRRVADLCKDQTPRNWQVF